jgi:hypothetical protein
MMKSWLGVIGRACLEFAIILILVSFAAGASTSVDASSGETALLFRNTARAALDLIPLAAVITIFLAFFAFEQRIRSRAAGWIGLLCLGVFLLGFGFGIRQVPVIRDALAVPSIQAQRTSFIPAGVAAQRDRVALYIGAYKGGEAVDAVAVDFASDYPRLTYSSLASLDSTAGSVEIQGKEYAAVMAPGKQLHLVPEASFFEGSWIWDRLAAMDGEPWDFTFAMIGGFVLLAIGFRFLCRLTRWPLANALLAAAGLAGLVALDAFLSGPGVLGFVESIANRSGISLPRPLLLASIEGALGLIFGVIDLTTAPKRKRSLDE